MGYWLEEGEAWKMVELKDHQQLDMESICSVIQLCLTLCDPMDWSTPGFPVHHQLLDLAQTHVHWVGDAIQPSHPLSSPSPPTFNLSQDLGPFQWVSSLHQVAKVLELQLQHQSFQISLRINCFDLLALLGTLKNLLQNHSKKASVLWCSAFFMVQLSHPNMTTEKTISESRSVVSDSLWPHGLYSPWNSPGQNIRVGSLSLLQVIFWTLGSNPSILHCRQILYQLSYKGIPRILKWIAYPFSRGFLDPRNKSMQGSPALQADSLPTELSGKKS